MVLAQIRDYLDTPGTKADMTGDRADELAQNGELFVRTRIDTREVWENVYEQERTPSHADTVCIGIALGKLEWPKEKRRFDGRPPAWVRVRPGATPREIAFGYMPVGSTRPK